MSGMQIGTGTFGVVIAAVIIMSSFESIPEGTRGVYLKNGAMQGIVEPGLQTQNPFIGKYVRLPLVNQRLEVEGAGYSFDNQDTTYKVVVNYRLDPRSLEAIFKNEGTDYEARRVRPIVIDAFEKVLSAYKSLETPSARVEIAGKARADVEERLQPYGFIVSEFTIEGLQLDPSITDSINQTMRAQAEKQRELENNARELATARNDAAKAEQDAIRANHAADAEAYQQRVIADAKAHAIREAGQAEADSIRAKTEALAQSAQLVELTKAEALRNWDGKLPSQMIPGAALPFLDLGKSGIQ